MTPTLVAKRETREERLLAFRAEVVPTTWNAEKRTAEIVWTAGADVLRYDWETGRRYWERLDFSEGSIRLERMQSGRLSILDAHSQYSLRDVLGVVLAGTVKIDSAKRRGTCVGQFTAAEDVAPLVQRIAEGVVASFSFGYKRYRVEQTDEQRDGFPVWIVRDWEPFEISPVPIPADPGAGIRSDEQARGETHPCVFERGESTMEPTNAPAATATVNEAERQRETAEIERKAVEAERKRAAEIERLGKRAGLEDKFVRELIGKGGTLEDARAAILDERARVDEQTPTRGNHPAVVVGVSGDEKLMRAMTDGIYFRARGVAPPDAAEGYRDFAGMRLLRIAEFVLRRQGINCERWSDYQISTAVFRAGAHGTADYPQLLANVAGKTLRQAYLEAPTTFEPIVRRTFLSDFKAASRVQTGSFPSMKEVPQNGVIEQGTFGDTAQGIQLKAFGRGWGVSWQAIVNDDLEGFSRIPVMVAGAARRLESDLVYLVITGNQVMDETGLALFHATHGNLLSGGGSALAVAGLAAARNAMANQKTPEGAYLNLNGVWLLVPTILEVTGLQLVAPLVPAVTTNVNPYAGKLQGPLSEPRLGAAGGATLTRWFLIADKTQIDTIELANLAGQEDITLEWEPTFQTLGMNMRAYCARAAAAIEYRGMVRSEGA